MYNRIIKLSIYVLVFLLPLFFLPFSFEAFEFNKQYLLFFLVSLAFLAWLAKMLLVDKEIRFRRSPLDLFVLAFCFIAILSAVFSVDKVSSWFGFYGRFSDGLISLLSLVLLYFVITNNVGIRSEKLKAKNEEEKDEGPASIISIQGIIKTFIWSIFFVVLFSYLSFFGVLAKLFNFQFSIFNFQFKLPSIMSQTIFNPTAGSPEGLAVFLAVFLMFLIGRTLIADKKNKRTARTINYFLIITISILLIIIDFDSAWLMIALSLILFLTIVLWKRMFKKDVNKLLVPILFVVLASAFLFINTSNFQFPIGAGTSQLPKEQVLSQGQSWLVGFKGATENIKSGFLGSGIGTFHYDFSKFKPVKFNQSMLWQIRFDRAGSHLAEILGTMGFLGWLSYLVLIGMFLLISYFFLQQNRSAIPLLLAFLALLVGQFVFYQNTVLAFTFWLVLGLSVVNWQKPVQEKSISFKDFPELSLILSILLIVFGLAILAMYFFAGRFYLADINYQKAMGTTEGTQKLEKAVSLNPFQTHYKIVLARDYLNKIVTEYQKPVDQIDQTTLSVNVYQAITYAKGGQIGRNTIKGAVEISPNRVAAWETLGMIYRDIQGIVAGALEWGMKSFEKAISLEPANPVLHTELGKLYLVSGDNNKGREEFNKAKELKPDYLDASIQIAFLYEKENNLEEAIRQMENLVTIYPFNIEVLFQLGRFYFNNEQVDSAILQFERVISLVPNHSNTLYSLGLAYQKKGQKEKAIDSFEKALELNPGNEFIIQKLEELRK